MSRRTPRLRFLPLLCVLALPGAAHAGSAEIAKETLRAQSAEQRLVHFWWLPLEFWESSARELKWPEERIAKVREAFRDYTMLAALDVSITSSGGAEGRTIKQIVDLADIEVAGVRVGVLPEVKPELAEFAPDLAYVLKASLVGLGESLRLLPLPNRSQEGKPVLDARAPGDLVVRYRAMPDRDPMVFRWYAPLTAVAGPTRCPTGGEALEASWTYCPYHGVKVR